MWNDDNHGPNSPPGDGSSREGDDQASKVERYFDRSLAADSSVDTSEITISTVIRVRAGREEDFEAYLTGMYESVAEYPGFLGARLFRPSRGDNRYRILLRFDSESSLRTWNESEARQLWFERGEEFAEAPPWSTNITGTAQAARLALARTPLEEYVRSNVSGIGLLLIGTVLALIAANSPLADGYADFWNTYLTIGTEDYNITANLRHWVNDCLMALFFFVVGLEIKREVLVGELRYPRQAALPIAAAIGGAVGPAAVYLLIAGREAFHGWGIPIGTDTAFSLGLITLFATRVLPQLLVFLTAFAIIDDIVAVLVIAVFYTDQLNWYGLGAAVVLMFALVLANRAGVYRWPVYAFLGFLLWLAIFQSGIHGTLAGVLVAMVVPSRAWINPSEFLARGRRIMNDFEQASYSTLNMLTNEHQQRSTHELERLTEQVGAPLTQFMHRLHGPVYFFVVPVFAFANAGIPIREGLGEALSNPVSWGVILGLLVGKPIGITLFTWAAVRMRLALLPTGMEMRHILGVAFLGGIGFTMSLFISELAFGVDPLADVSRIGILIGSAIAGIGGYLILDRTLPPPRPDKI